MSGFSALLARSVFALRLPHINKGSAVDGGDGGPGPGGDGAPPAPDDAAAADQMPAPPAAAAASNPSRSGAYRAVVFDPPHTDTGDGLDLVGSGRRVTVSCCRCPRVLRLSASGYGEMARRAEAAGWRYTPGGHLHDRAWCPDCARAPGRPSIERSTRPPPGGTGRRAKR
ncbi:hypothetical protein L0U85_09625 [Glycomyces sp. L485]|uniref:hypothetical protein n=1 Tax=Glycomyces sp. L485 TaxID=2909235 RepID=UPI001F4A20C2|nr:hypothetical protein [Glycomyces sp. L485]MCH7231110.1 hypothetical protein [Glycomyces sp. L485]